MWPFTYSFSFFVDNILPKSKDDSTVLIAYIFFSLISFAPCEICVLRFTSCMWNWVRCGPLLIYVNVDNQTEK